MKAITTAIIVYSLHMFMFSFIHPSEIVAQERCRTQNYDNADVEPDYSCPGPGEDVIIPSMSYNPSRGLVRGSTILPMNGDKIVLGYDAVLMDKNKTIELGLTVKGLRKLRWMDLKFVKKMFEVNLNAEKSVFNSRLDFQKSRVETCINQRDEIKKELESSSKWYKSWPVGAIIGSMVTAAVMTAVFAAVE